jgi:signal peptidase I
MGTSLSLPMTLSLSRARALLLLAALAGSVTACTPRFKSYYIPSESMQPTLQVNDRIVTDRDSYQQQSPQRGDIVIFQPPDRLIQMLKGSMAVDAKTVFVKRVIGLPGDVIEIKQGQVYVNTKPLPETYLLEAPDYVWGPVKVPAASFVVLGDNRNNAFDSHYWGMVPRRYLLGKVVWRYWPPDRLGAVQ